MNGDFLLTDGITMLTLSPVSARARTWVSNNLEICARYLLAWGAVRTAPGYMVDVILPEVRKAGLTVGGDLDVEGRVRVMVQG